MKQYNLSLDDANSLLNEAGSLKFFEEVRLLNSFDIGNIVS